MPLGTSLAGFHKQFELGDRVVAIVSKVYLHQPFCMLELVSSLDDYALMPDVQPDPPLRLLILDDAAAMFSDRHLPELFAFWDGYPDWYWREMRFDSAQHAHDTDPKFRAIVKVQMNLRRVLASGVRDIKHLVGSAAIRANDYAAVKDLLRR